MYSELFRIPIEWAGVPIFGFGVLLLLTACSTSSNVKNPTPVPSQDTTGPPLETEYVIQSGDLLDIKFFYNPELSEKLTVRPDGRIALQLIDEVMAGGLTPQELKVTLIKQYSKELRDPDITIILRKFSGKVFVGGEVGKPGQYDLEGNLTVLQAIARAGGLKETAWREAIVIRRLKDQPPLIFELDLGAVIQGKEFSQDIGLMPFDVVYVPRSPIANVNLWVKQYIRSNIPFDFGFFLDPF